MTIGSLRVLKWSHRGWQPVRGSPKPAVGSELASGAWAAPGSGDQPRSATAETPTWWDLAEQKAL